jgi:hypothetical protein
MYHSSHRLHLTLLKSIKLSQEIKTRFSASVLNEKAAKLHPHTNLKNNESLYRTALKEVPALGLYKLNTNKVSNVFCS